MCADPPAILLWLDVARDTLAPLWEGQCGAVLRAAARSSCKANAASFLVFLRPGAGDGCNCCMGLAPGRHKLGQQVVEIDGLNAEYSVLFTQAVG